MAVAQTWFGVVTVARQKQRCQQDGNNETVGGKNWLGGSGSGSDGSVEMATTVVCANLAWLGISRRYGSDSGDKRVATVMVTALTWLGISGSGSGDTASTTAAENY